jgi:hypothetical protein
MGRRTGAAGDASGGTVQLAEIQRRLLDTPSNDFATRNALRRSQDDLRAEAVALRETRPQS